MNYCPLILRGTFNKIPLNRTYIININSLRNLFFFCVLFVYWVTLNSYRCRYIRVAEARRVIKGAGKIIFLWYLYLNSSFVGVGRESFLLWVGWNPDVDASAAAAGWLTAIDAGLPDVVPAAAGSRSDISWRINCTLLKRNGCKGDNKALFTRNVF